MPDHDRPERPPDRAPGAMTWNDMVILLALAAGDDQRTVGDDDVRLWLVAAQIHRWVYSAAERVIIEYYSVDAGRPRITRAAVTDRLRELRRRAAGSFETPRIPDGLPNREYPAWLRARLAEHTDGELRRWATTGQPVRESLPVEPSRFRALDQAARAGCPDDGRRRAVIDGVKRLSRSIDERPELPGPRVSTRRQKHDPARRATAEHELAELRREQETDAIAEARP